MGLFLVSDVAVKFVYAAPPPLQMFPPKTNIPISILNFLFLFCVVLLLMCLFVVFLFCGVVVAVVVFVVVVRRGGLQSRHFCFVFGFCVYFFFRFNFFLKIAKPLKSTFFLEVF